MDTLGLRQLAELIYNNCGIDYLKNYESLNMKVASRLKELGLSCWEYCGYIKVEPSEWNVLIELITVNETFFFREDNLLDELKNVIFPKFKDASASKPLRIWCAACSTGEEPYTVAMLAKETGLFEEGSIEIVASDINTRVLNKAKTGMYNKKSFSFRKMPEDMLNKYFIEAEEDYIICSDIKKMIDFRHINMVDANLPGKLEKMDIILCRNVLIYFDSNSIKKAVNNFYNILKPEGFLMLGHAETINNISTDFQTIYTQNLFYYRKGDNPLCSNTEF